MDPRCRDNDHYSKIFEFVKEKVMRKVQNLTINYCGYKEPETEDELNMEILGLENAVRNAELRISMLKQGLHLNKMLKSAISAGEKVDAKTLDPSNAKVEQTEQKAK